MSITDKSLATPKKGKAIKSRGNFRTVTQAKATGRVMSLQKVSNKAGSMLVKTVTGASSGRSEDMLASIKKGLKFSSINHLEAAYGASRKEIAEVLSIPLSTLTRRKNEGRLHTDESDRVVRLAQLKGAVLAMVNDDDDTAITWLRTPLDVLGGESPMKHASTEWGARDVEDLIGRLCHGVFS